MKRAKTYPKQESVADFKARIAAKLRGNAPESFPIRRTPTWLIRKPADRGYYPPPRVVTEGDK